MSGTAEYLFRLKVIFEAEFFITKITAETNTERMVNMNGEVFEQAQEMQQLMEVALRIKEIRETLSLSVSDMAQKTGMSTSDYEEFESGKKDFNFTFIYKKFI